MKSTKYLFYDPHDGFSGAYMPRKLVDFANSLNGKVLTLKGIERKIKQFAGKLSKVEFTQGMVLLYSSDPKEAFRNNYSLTCWRFLRYKRVSGKKPVTK